MGFLKVLKKVGIIAGHAVPDVVRVWNPALGGILESVMQGVLQAEAKFGSGRGAEKKQYVLENLQVAAPLVLALVEGAAGRDLVDDEEFSAGLSKLIDGTVSLLNACGALPQSGVTAGG